MATQKIVLAELDLDTQGLIKSAAGVKKEILDLREEQKQLKKAGEEGSVQFVRNEAELKRLSGTYNLLNTAVKSQIDSTGKLVTQEEALNTAVAKVNVTEQEYLNNNRELIKLRKELVIPTESLFETQEEYNDALKEYQTNLTNINGKLNENNDWIKENVSAYEQQKISIGDYRTQIVGAFEDLNIFNGGILGFISRSQEAGGVGNLLSNSFKAITTGIWGATKAGLAFIATPLGAIIAAIAVAAGILWKVFSGFVPIMDKVEQITAAVAAVFNVLKNAVIALFTGAKSLGEVFSGLGGAMSQAAKDAANLKKAQQDLEDAMQSQEVASAKNRVEINKLNTMAKDRTKTEEERLAMLQKAAKMEEDDFNARKKNADQALANAEEEIRIAAELSEEEFQELKKRGLDYKEFVEGRTSDTDEMFETLKDALLKQADIDNEFTTNMEKNIVKQNKLIEDAEAKRAKAAEDATKLREENEKKAQEALNRQVQRLNIELDIFLQNQESKARSLSEEIKLAEDVRDKKLAIAKAEYKASQKTSNDNLKLLQAENAAKLEFLQASAEAAQKFGQAEIDYYIQINQTKINSEAKLTQAIIDEEQKRLKSIRDMNLKQLELVKGTNQETIDQKKAANQALSEADLQYLTEKSKIEQQYSETIAANKKELDDQTKAAEVARLEADKQIRLNAAKDEYDKQVVEEGIRHEEYLERLKQQLANEQITKAQYDLLEQQESKKNTDMLNDIERGRQDFRLGLASQTLGNLTTIMGKESAASKALAITQTTIDTYRSATAAYAALAGIVPAGPVLGAIAAAAAVASGLANVKKIASTKPPKAERGALFGIGGARHSAGGTMFTGEDGTSFEAERGELIGVMNRNAAKHFMAFNNAFPSGAGSAPNFFASGGLVSREIAPDAMNMDALAMKIAEANRALPAPVVAVTDIATVNDKMVSVQQNSNY